MKFDIVIGNPPYNNDIYLDFVEKSFELSSNITCMITPAKWQAKGGEKNKQFRADIVPHMSKIVYYPDCTDVFAIAEAGGIGYYILDKLEHQEIIVENKCKLQDLYNDKDTRSIRNRETLINKGNIINNNESIKNSKKFSLFSTDKNKKYQVWLNNKLAIGGGKSQGTYLFSNEGMMQCLSISRLVDKDGDTSDVVADSQLVFTSDNKNECEYFLSWIYTRFVRFLISINLGGLTGVANPNNDWWRFVPDPGTFDHIFTDEELYKKYNLTPEEINIIESVIKERK